MFSMNQKKDSGVGMAARWLRDVRKAPSVNGMKLPKNVINAVVFND